MTEAERILTKLQQEINLAKSHGLAMVDIPLSSDTKAVELDSAILQLKQTGSYFCRKLSPMPLLVRVTWNR